MPIKDRVCPKCDSSMTPGYTIDRDDFTPRLTEWITGVPTEKKMLFGKRIEIDKDRRRFVLGFCCEKCGFVELYAVNEADVRYHLRQTAMDTDSTSAE